MVQGAGAYDVTCLVDTDNDGWYTTVGQFSICSVNYNSPTVCDAHGGTNAATYTGPYDADDTDDRITYLGCPAGEYFVHEQVDHIDAVSHASLAANDFALQYKPTDDENFLEESVGACVPGNANFCVTGDSEVDNFINTFASDSLIYATDVSSSRITPDEVSYCSTNCDGYGCSILDCDSDSNTCSNECGFSWGPAGDNYLGIGEYASAGRSECCGDDANEGAVVQHCAGSTTKDTVPSLCCPQDGNEYFILDNECVLECPDVMQTKPTWVDLASTSDALYQSYDAVLDGTNGYCCDGTPGSQGPLCGTDVGCYIQLDLANQGDGRIEYCDTSAGDDWCVLEACLNVDDYDFCEKLTTCTDQFTPVPYVLGDERESCSVYSSNWEAVENSFYAKLPNGCSAANVNNCEAFDREVCSGVNCEALCQVDSDGNPINCELACESYSCETVTSYHGPYCTFDVGCEPFNITQELTQTIDVDSVSSCTSYTVCNEFGCSCGECTAYGCPSCSESFVRSVSCSEGEACTKAPCNNFHPLGDFSLHCFNDMEVQGYSNNYGNELVVKVKGNADLNDQYLQCDPTGGIEEGDPICQYGEDGEYGYEPSVNSCIAGEAFCDFTIAGSAPLSTNGCNNLLLAADDPLGQYDADCVSDDVVPSAYTNVYDLACCPAYTINNLDVYENTGNNVRVY